MELFTGQKHKKLLATCLSFSDSGYCNRNGVGKNTALSSNADKMLVVSLGGFIGDDVSNGRRVVVNFIGVEWGGRNG